MCTDSGFINCAKVTTSAQSEILGIPVAILGLGQLLGDDHPELALGLACSASMGSRGAIRSGHRGDVLRTVARLRRVDIIGNICLYCTGVHITTFALLIVLTLRQPGPTGLEPLTRELTPAARTH